LNIGNNESKNNDESSRKDDKEVVDVSDAESCNPDLETISETKSRGKGRPALLKTGRLDRLKEVYQSEEARRQDPRSAFEIIEKDDAQL